MFTAKKISVRLDLLSLFESHPVVRYIKVYDATISIEKNAKGENSIVFNSVQNTEKKEVPETAENSEMPKYPIEPLPFGGLEIFVLDANFVLICPCKTFLLFIK